MRRACRTRIALPPLHLSGRLAGFCTPRNCWRLSSAKSNEPLGQARWGIPFGGYDDNRYAARAIEPHSMTP